MIQSIGNPMKVETQKVENRHQPGVMDAIYKLAFDSLAVDIYDAGGKEIMLYQKITSPKYKVKHGLNIGASKERITDVFGLPQEVNENKLIYAYQDELGYETIIVFSITEDKISAIEWNFPID